MNLSTYQPTMNYRYIYQQGLEEFHKGDYYEAKKLFEKAAEDRIPEAYFALGSLYYSGKGATENKTKAKELLAKACDLGDPEACMMLANLYYDKERIDSDLETMVALLEKACNAGMPDACKRYEVLKKKLGFFGKMLGAFM
jgi:TPR repeat protein